MQTELLSWVGAGHGWEITTERKIKPLAIHISGCEIIYDERGNPQVNSQYISHIDTNTSRKERIAIRMKLSQSFSECVQYGYLIGNDPETKTKSDPILLHFLQQKL